VLPGRKYKVEDILGILWKSKWLILAPLVICSAGTYVAAKRMPNLYKSETLILVVPQKVPESYVRSTVSGRIEDRLPSLKEQILSRSRLERIVVDFNLYSDARKTRPLESVIDSMRSAIKIDIVRGGEAFSVTYVSGDARVAQAVTERLASLFIQENVHDREKLAVGTSEFLQTQLDDARRRLIEQEQKLQQYRLTYAGQLPTQAPANLQALQNSRLQLQALDDAVARARDRQVTLERQAAQLLTADGAPAAAAPPAADGSQEPAGATAREQLEDGRRKLVALEARLKPAHPDITRLKRRLAQLEEKSRIEAASPAVPQVTGVGAAREGRVLEIRADLEAVKREIAAKQDEQRKIHGEMALYQSRLDAAPIRESELTELMRDYETIQSIYTGLLAKREDSKVAANLELRQVGEQFRVLDPARVPQAPFSPDRMRIELLGIAAGLLLGLGAAGLREYLDQTLKTEDDVRSVLGLPVIATVPVLTGTRKPAGSWRTRVARRAPVGAVVGLVIDAVRNLRG
jgi:polysaccharide chain length determinant protein (PEP-CTERM system associated)